MDQNVVSYSNCEEGLTEILELLLVVLDSTEDLSMDVQIRSPTKNIDSDMIFLIKIISSRPYCIESLVSCYGNYLQKFSNLIMKMQMMENESHITFSICENGEIIRKSYFLETGIDGAYKLKCTKHRAKNTPNPTNTVLHLRMFQSKHSMMLLGKKIYHHLKQISLCSKVSLSLSLTVQENVCHFDIRSVEDGQEISSAGPHVSTNTKYLLSESQFPPLLISTKVALSHDNQELPVISDLPELAFQLVTAGVKTNCHYMYNTNTCTSSLIMLSWYGPGSVPLFEIGDTNSEIKLLKSLDWSQYGMVAAAENSMLWEGQKPCQESIQLKPMHGNSCFVLSLYISIDVITKEDPRKKLEALSWLRKNRNKWMEKFKEEIDCSLNSVIRQIEKPIRTADEDRITLQYNTAIASISLSISNVVLRSSCEQFRSKCYQLLETEERSSVQQVVSKKLWCITENMGISRPVNAVESEDPSLDKNRNLAFASQTEYQKSENESAGDHEMCIHEEDLEGLNWLPEKTGASLDESNQGIPISKWNSALEEEKTGVSQESEVLTDDNWGTEARNSLRHQNSHEGVYENIYCLAEKNTKLNCEDQEDIFSNEKEADTVGCEGIAHENNIYSFCEDSRGLGIQDQCKEIQEESSTEKEFEKHITFQQGPFSVERIIGTINSEAMEKSNTEKKIDDWLDDALLEMRDWFNDE